MNELCRCGSGKEVKEFGEFSFYYKGFCFSAVRAGSECNDCSFDKKCIITAFDKYGEKLVSKEGDFLGIGRNLIINWDFYCKFMEEKHEEDKQSLNDILVALGIFSICSENNWEIIADGSLNLDPCWHSSQLYFTRECDVRKYAKLKFSNTLYHWMVRRIAQVIKKSDIVG